MCWVKSKKVKIMKCWIKSKEGVNMKSIVKIMMFGVLLIGLVGCGNKGSEADFEKECLNNLRLLDSEVLMFAMEEGLSDGAVVLPEQIDSFESLKCPDGGQYKLNPVGVPPECSVHGTLK